MDPEQPTSEQAPAKTGIELAVEKYDGSSSRLAAALNGVTRQVVDHWRKIGRVPADKAPDVQAVTGVPVDLLCPGVNWDAVRQAPTTQEATVAGA